MNLLTKSLKDWESLNSRISLSENNIAVLPESIHKLTNLNGFVCMKIRQKTYEKIRLMKIFGRTVFEYYCGITAAEDISTFFAPQTCVPSASYPLSHDSSVFLVTLTSLVA